MQQYLQDATEEELESTSISFLTSQNQSVTLQAMKTDPDNYNQLQWVSHYNTLFCQLNPNYFSSSQSYPQVTAT